MYLRLFSFLFIMSVIPKSFAGLLIEPYVGANGGTYSSEIKTGGFSIGSPMDSKLSGTAYGGRVGFKLLAVWAAIDYMAVNWAVKYDKPLSTPDGTAKGQFIFADVGVDLPFLFRFYGGYGFSNYLKGTGNNSAGVAGEEVLKGGSALKAGIGFSFIKFLSLNLEYIKPTYTSYAVSSGGVSSFDGSADTNFKSLDQSFTMVSLSFPFSLL